MRSIVKIGLGIVLGFVLLIGGCAAVIGSVMDSDDSDKKSKDKVTAAAEPAADTEETEEEPEELPDVVMPEPSGTFTHSCDYVLGDFTAYTQSGYRFIADAQLHNDGNIGTVNKVDAVWFLSGGGKVTMSKTIRVKAGKRARVGFTKPVGSDEIDLHQSLGYDAKRCNVKVTMIDTFGDIVE